MGNRSRPQRGAQELQPDAHQGSSLDALLSASCLELTFDLQENIGIFVLEAEDLAALDKIDKNMRYNGTLSRLIMFSSQIRY